jgi:outer membrane immunogenic protein
LDFDAADIKSTVKLGVPPPAAAAQTIKTDELASLRARLGWEVRPDLLAYGTAGLALGHFQATINNTAPTSSLITSGGATELGWVAGAGLEYKLLGRWLLRAEYLHYDFGTVSNMFGSVDTNPPVDSFNARSTFDVVRGGVSYKF